MRRLHRRAAHETGPVAEQAGDRLHAGDLHRRRVVQRRQQARQPLESGRISVERVAAVAHFPGRFQLVLAANPCPCGQAGTTDGTCTCTPAAQQRYRARLSGPLADRIDLHVHVSAVPVRQLAERSAGECSESVRARVERARARQRARYGARAFRCNGHAPGRWLETETPVAAEARELLTAAAERLALSARAYHRVLRVARTIADLDDSACVGLPHVAEALRFRGDGHSGDGSTGAT